MKKFILTFFAACLVTALSATTVNYTALPDSIFPNPERGFITMLERHGYQKKNAVKGKESYLTNLRNNDKGSLILVLYYLDEFKNVETIPDTMLSAFDEDMAVLRNYGMKCILRFAYTNEDYQKVIKPGDTVRTAADAPLEIIQKHLAQYKSHWQANADVIFCFQAGFVGQYGEWYYTDNFDNKSSHMTSKRKQFMDTLMNATPQNRTVQLRTPLFKTEYMDSLHVSKAALTAEEAYTGTAKARLGQHNDAFLNGPLNQGTYRSISDTAAQKSYIAQETLYVPIGGECNISKTDTATKYANYAATIAEMSRLHWTFIQGGFSKTVTDMWRANGTFDTLNVHMGYRFQLVKSTLPTEVLRGSNMAINIKLVNVGYAPLYNKRDAYIVLKNESDSIAIKLATDPRTWKPNGDTTVINEEISLSNDIPTGDYQLYLNLPDEYTSLAHDPRYSVRFANSDVWEQTSGMNKLRSSLHLYVNSAALACKVDSVVLPATLDTANVTAYSNDMTMQNGDYFDFGPTDALNTDRWVEWKVYLKYPGKYYITEETYCANSHQYGLFLMNGNDTIAIDSTAKCHQTGHMTIKQSEKWDLSAIPAGVYKLRVKNVMGWARPKLKRLKLEYDGLLPEGAILLPATLNKANVESYSEDMTWYGASDEYFDFGPEDESNLERWAEWKVDLRYPGNYNVSATGYYPNGHEWAVVLLNSEADTLHFTRTWTTGELTENSPSKWDLSLSKVPAGIYIIQVKNVFSYSRPKLLGLTLTYDGEIPSGVEEAIEIEGDGRMYDILGRPVDESYRGVVIMRGKKILR